MPDRSRRDRRQERMSAPQYRSARGYNNMTPGGTVLPGEKQKGNHETVPNYMGDSSRRAVFVIDGSHPGAG